MILKAVNSESNAISPSYLRVSHFRIQLTLDLKIFENHRSVSKRENLNFQRVRQHSRELSET